MGGDKSPSKQDQPAVTRDTQFSFTIIPMTSILTFILLISLSYLSVWIIRRYTEQRQILDHPNERSSHVTPTPRGGGLVIVFLVLGTGLWWVFDAGFDRGLIYIVCGVILAWLGVVGVAMGTGPCSSINYPRTFAPLVSLIPPVKIFNHKGHDIYTSLVPDGKVSGRCTPARAGGARECR